ncbi:MAG: winged helix-turn-helix domain-containing protein [Caldilineaceae bacterium]
MTQGSSYWADFPDTYRAEQIETIAGWIARGESGVVVGGSGAGKSNLVGFFTTRQDVVGRLLPGDVDDYVFLHLDVNGLPTINAPFFYRAMLLGLQNAARKLDPALLADIKSASEMLIGLEDTLGLHFVLQQAHETLVSTAGKRIVWTIDRFDEALVKLDAYTLNSLRSLRDTPSLKGKLSYIVFTRHPLARLREPREYDEFHEIMVPNICWVGPMAARDAKLIAEQMAERHGITFNDDAVELLLQLSGNLPAFMKAASTALASGLLAPGEPVQVWLDRILDSQSILRNCQEMWDDLTDGEKEALSAVAVGTPESELDAIALQYLVDSRLVERRQVAGGNVVLRVFSPIFELFVLRQRMDISNEISLDPRTGALTVNNRVLPTKLTPIEHRLLAYLIEHKGEKCSADELIAHTWSDGALSSDVESPVDRLDAVVSQLRGKIEFDPVGGVLLQRVDGEAYRLIDAQTANVHISIDEKQFQDQVRKIVDSDFFRDLETRARDMRQARTDVNRE